MACPRVGRWVDWGRALGVWASRQNAPRCAACVPCWDLWAVRVPTLSTSQTPFLKRKSMNWDEDCSWLVASVSVHHFWFWDLKPVMSFLLPYICWSLKAAALMGRLICLCLNYFLRINLRGAFWNFKVLFAILHCVSLNSECESCECIYRTTSSRVTYLLLYYRIVDIMCSQLPILNELWVS